MLKDPLPHVVGGAVGMLDNTNRAPESGLDLYLPTCGQWTKTSVLYMHNGIMANSIRSTLRHSA